MAERLMFRGDFFSFDAQVLRDNKSLDITGWTVVFSAKKLLSDADNQAVIRLSTSLPPTILIASPTLGKITVNVPPSATASLPNVIQVLYYDVRALDPGGNPMTIDSGALTILPNATLTVS